ncbi:MAG TPA: flagellar basal body rod protein FlgB [Ruminiclostridium sp.]|nr:flagellar basal body rod protein FlgB [Ruminiclostridium sp.]
MSSIIGSMASDIANKSLNALWTRANVISNNIANNDTPGYKEKYVDFESQLSEALSGNTINEEQLSGVNPVVKENEGTYGANGNGVDMENELVELTRNQMQYSYMERSVADSYSMLLAAARGGK